jgi:molybdopterin-guanine dinucleotide biosynthesis protein A
MDSGASGAPLFGLVLAGGASRRMGQDKGALVYHAEPQVLHAWRLLSAVCEQAYVSTNRSRATAAPYRELPLILDDGDFEGPIAGLEAAWRLHPGAAWLVLAVDMPLVDVELLNVLVAARNSSALATAFENDDGVLEPLCAVWEPAAREALNRAMRAGERSPRRFLESHAAATLRAPRPGVLTSVNGYAEYEALRRKLQPGRQEPRSPIEQ